MVTQVNPNHAPAPPIAPPDHVLTSVCLALRYRIMDGRLQPKMDTCIAEFGRAAARTTVSDGAGELHCRNSRQIQPMCP